MDQAAFDPFVGEPVAEHVTNIAGAMMVTTPQGVDVTIPGIPTVHGSTVTAACEAALAALRVVREQEKRR